MKIAINGFGRIGRNVYRLLSSRDDIEVVAINDIADPEPLAYLLKYDTVMGKFDGEIQLDGDLLYAAKQRSRFLQVRDPRELPWKEMGVDAVVEATGRFRRRSELQQHLEAGADRVVLTVPAKDEIDATVVLGVNDDDLRSEHRIVSNASCTTNCLAPLAKVLDDNFGLVRGMMTTVHAYTNDQRLSDWYHADLRRSRAAAENTIPTTTGAARAVGSVLPKLKGRLDGMAIRVPVPDGSIVDLAVQIDRAAGVEEINAAMREAAEGPMRGILQYSTEALVSSDIVGNPHSCIFDAPLTRVVDERQVKVFAWYDNEWGYSARIVDLLLRLDGM
ncbi:MAG: type I glyceraldehyde-3-phosphate dehydrogenase [bacterium]|nr:type I glyceraldehyde-3-phosphate dehydrogenase [bacterium]